MGSTKAKTTPKAAKAAKATKKTTTTAAESEEKFWKAIEANPDEPDAYLVYGDWLTEARDPLGELIAVQTALAKAKLAKRKNDALLKREKELFALHEKTWLDAFADRQRVHERRNPFTGQMQSFPPSKAETIWRYGFLETVQVDGPEDLDMLLGLRVTRFLRTLELRPELTQLIDLLATRGVPRTLRRLVLDIGEHQISFVDIGDLSRLYKRLGHLEELRITAGSMELGDIDLPKLKSFEVITGGFSTQNARSVAKAKWPKLESLVLYFGETDYGATSRIRDIQPILDGQGLAQLTHLGLCNSVFADDIAKVIVKAKILPQLKTLDLSKGTMGDVGARALIKGAKRLMHLKRIDLTKNYISEDVQEELQTAFGKLVDASDQNDTEVDNYYVQVGE